MRKVIVSEFVTLDGVIGGLDQWSAFHDGGMEEQEKFKSDGLASCDALLLPRVAPRDGLSRELAASPDFDMWSSHWLATTRKALQTA